MWALRCVSAVLAVQHVVHNSIVDVEQDAAALLAALSLMLRSVQCMGAPIMISCPSAFTLLRTLALSVGTSAMELLGDDGTSAATGCCVYELLCLRVVASRSCCVCELLRS